MSIAGQCPVGAERSTRGRTVASVAEAFGVWRRRSRERRALRRALWWYLDERMLRDIGLDPVDVRREAGKPFWRE